MGVDSMARGLALARVPYVSGRPTAFEGPAAISAGGAAVAGLLRISPYMVRRRVTIGSLIVRVTTLAASGNFQLLVYASDPVLLDPIGAPIFQSSNQSTAAVASIEVASVNKIFDPHKIYWIGCQVDTNGASAVFTAVGTADPFFARIVGNSAITNSPSSSQLNCMTKTGTFNSPPTLTGNRTTDSFTETNAVAPYVTFKPA
jgi:hypothetical protein